MVENGAQIESLHIKDKQWHHADKTIKNVRSLLKLNL